MSSPSADQPDQSLSRRTASSLPDEVMASVSVCFGRRCGFCRFTLRPGDSIIQVRPDGEFSNPLRFLPDKPLIDEKQSASYMTCPTKCTNECFHFCRSVACHVDCLRLRANAPLWQFFKTTDYSFYVPPATDDARRVYLQCRLAANIRLPVFLPPELRMKIAKDLVQPYAAALAAAMPFNPANLSPYVSLYDEVWAVYLKIDGIRYTAALTNWQPRGDARMLYSPLLAERFNAIHICEDHVGIRQIIFGKEDATLPAPREENVWWKRLPLPGEYPNIRSQFDGTKVRSLTLINGIDRVCSTSEIHWPIPKPALSGLRMHRLVQFNGQNPPPIFMGEFYYNRKRMTSISMPFCRGNLAGFHAHKKNRDNNSIYKDSPWETCWLYMPLDKGEAVIETWLRKSSPGMNRHTIVFKTNMERICVMGPFLNRYTQGSHEWILLDKPRGKPSHLYYDSRIEGSRFMGLLSKLPKKTPKPPVIHAGLSFNTRFGVIYYSSAPLKDVKAIRRCSRADDIPSCSSPVDTDFPSLTGMLIQYENGHLERVGEVRQDCLEPDWTERGDLNKLVIRFGFFEQYTYIAAIGFEDEETDCGNNAMELPLDGLLEWWFSRQEMDIRHGDKRIPMEL